MSSSKTRKASKSKFKSWLKSKEAEESKITSRSCEWFKYKFLEDNLRDMNYNLNNLRKKLIQKLLDDPYDCQIDKADTW